MFDGHVKVVARKPKLGVLAKTQATIDEEDKNIYCNDFNLKHSSITCTFRPYIFE